MIKSLYCCSYTKSQVSFILNYSDVGGRVGGRSVEILSKWNQGGILEIY